MSFGASSSRGAVVGLRCPKCGEVQARARKPAGSTYPCRRCGHELTREANEKDKKR